MTSMQTITGEIVDDMAAMFLPMSTDLVDGLIGQYQSERGKMERISEFFSDPGYRAAVGYFVEGARDDYSRYTPEVSKLFDIDKALAVLNATYWDRALKMTDVLDCMPQKRRDEWYEQISKRLTPEFSEESVRATIGDLLLSRSKFFAERVDGIFRSLSREHVTNQPEGFSKRMILNYVLNEYSSSQQGHINDLRCVIAKFMGRDEPRHGATGSVIAACKRNWGQWMTLDGGAIKIRVYKKGTAHLEVHPDMAWRLNAVLASIYPSAIPSRFREKPAKKLKEFHLMERPLPFAVLDILSQMKKAYNHVKNPTGGYKHVEVPNGYDFGYGSDKHASAEAANVLAAIGGTYEDGHFIFDYNPQAVIDEIVCSGCIPDHKSHQYYPTPEKLARIAVELAEIGPHDTCLEPSAGTGGIAYHLPKDRTRCVEVSPLHCKVLTEKGFDVVQADFIEWSGKTQERFERICLNPPFDQGRWQAHLNAAAKLLAPLGVLVAILPSSAPNKDLLPGFNLSWSRVYDNEFSGASVSVIILTARRAA